MRLTRLTPWSVVVLSTLAMSLILSGETMAKDKTPPPPPTAKKTAAPGTAKAKTATPTTFAGEVVKVTPSGNTGSLWVKHANGTIKLFNIAAATKVTGASSFSAVTKGSLVSVQYAKSTTSLVNVTKLAPPNPPDKVVGAPVTGTIVSVKTDSYGDTGSVTVQPAGGVARQFQATNATVVQHPAHKDFVHSLQFLAAGQTVLVEHDGGKIALLIQVTNVPGQK
jgi:hypothetical protein